MHLWAAVSEWQTGFSGLVHGLLFARDTRFRVSAGGQYGSLIDAGEVWRLWTSVFLHVDLLHLVVNALAIFALGRLLEPWIGPVRLWAWFLLGGVCGSAASYLLGVVQSDGASGGAFALLGAAVVLGVEYRNRLSEVDRDLMGRWLWGFLILNLVVSALVPSIDLIGHLGGLLTGAFAGFATGRSRAVTVRAFEGLWVAGCVVTCVAGWTYG